MGRGESADGQVEWGGRGREWGWTGGVGWEGKRVGIYRWSRVGWGGDRLEKWGASGVGVGMDRWSGVGRGGDRQKE